MAAVSSSWGKGSTELKSAWLPMLLTGSSTLLTMAALRTSSFKGICGDGFGHKEQLSPTRHKIIIPSPDGTILHPTSSVGREIFLFRHTACGCGKLKVKTLFDNGDKGAWSLCTVTQVEEAKIILRMVPVFLSSVLGNVPLPLLLALTVQQGGAMDTRLGATSIPPASLFIVPIVFQMLILVAYDRAAVPWLRRLTGYRGGVTHLQRVAVGFAASVAALVVAAAVEGRRRRWSTSPAMSVFWLTPQFFLLGVMDVTSFVGLLEFFYSEASVGMKSIGSAIVFCVLGVASWLGIFLIQVVNRVTSSGGAGGHGWLDGATLNASRLDLFYWLLALFGLLSFIYLLCACMYTYRHDPRMKPVVDDDMERPDVYSYVLGSFLYFFETSNTFRSCSTKKKNMCTQVNAMAYGAY
ncbi:hypothetical protein EJB05_02900 [Eragrostis curvula]|uniref:Protein NRT1/ PTR FAMILY 4.3 n=1 Tax=Eragrostis curvula TaxID=38414 RepID=A0A5J9WTM6_9POAL|nr:hypothetical protein EJB05_02900 [Eragrostis curvula]